jgi:Zn-dependent peptidase ImmA (M78 family)
VRLPRCVNFPFGFSIRVRQITRTEMSATVGEDAVAGWMQGARTIYLLKSRTMKQKRSDLAHELGHVAVDYVDYLLNSGLGKL